jgi:hypothetical protein
MSMLRVAILAVALVLPASLALAAGEHGLEQVLIESASTPAQHKALADHFRAEAASARREAERHRAMAKSYGGGKLVVAEAQRKHCENLAKSFDAQAADYDELAAAHDAEAKK